MKNVVIVSKWFVGRKQQGVDGGINIFKKSYSTLLEEKLNEKFSQNGLKYEAKVDNDDIMSIVNNENVDLILISPYIKDAVLKTLTDVEMEKCYFLTENEFINLELNGILDKCRC